MADRMETENIALTILTIAEVPNFWSGFLPSLFTIATFSAGDDEKVQHTKLWIRRGEVQASVMSVALGVAASVIAKSPLPFLGVLLIMGYLIFQYENALKKGTESGLGLDIANQ